MFILVSLKAKFSKLLSTNTLCTNIHCYLYQVSMLMFGHCMQLLLPQGTYQHPLTFQHVLMFMFVHLLQPIVLSCFLKLCFVTVLIICTFILYGKTSQYSGF